MFTQNKIEKFTMFLLLMLICFANNTLLYATNTLGENLSFHASDNKKIKFIKNLNEDYGLVDDNAQKNQTAIVQKAIDEVAKLGGGNILISKGVYNFYGVYLKSNVHLFIEKGTVVTPKWPKDTKTNVFFLDVKRKSKSISECQKFIENVSIQGYKGRFTVDYSYRKKIKGEGARAIACKMVRDFLISDMNVKDNYTSYCGIILTPSTKVIKNPSDWEITRVTNGVIKNCSIFNAHPGYGMVQLHGAQSVYFENLYALGGVTLRLETGAVGPNTAVFDITAKNITNEKGRCAVMFGPHSANNGVVKVDGIKTIASDYAVTMGKGSVKKAQLKIHPNAKQGSFAKGSIVKNIHAVYGYGAQIKKHKICQIPEETFGDLNLKYYDKFFEGPSQGAVRNFVGTNYKIIIENVTQEGFKYHNGKTILTEKDLIKDGCRWSTEFKKWMEDYGVKKNVIVEYPSGKKTTKKSKKKSKKKHNKKQ